LNVKHNLQVLYVMQTTHLQQPDQPSI